MKRTLIGLFCLVLVVICGCARETAAPNAPVVPAETAPAVSEIPADADVDFSAAVSVNEGGESVFAVPLRDFIASFNRTYKDTYLTAPSSAEWERNEEPSPALGYDAVRHVFAEKRGVWPPMPTVSVYSADADAIYEIRITFDDHDFQDGIYGTYESLCCALLQTGAPELSAEEAKDLFDVLYVLTDVNYYRSFHESGDPSHPPITRMLRIGDVGFYSFLDSGTTEICMIPLTSDAETLFTSEGTKIQTMQEFLAE